MNKRLPTNIFCSTYGHNYFRLNKANANTPELICKCCKSYFKFDHDGSITAVPQRENHKFSSIPFKRRIA